MSDLVPVGVLHGRGRPDFCRSCQTVTHHRFKVASHEWWDCALCGNAHFTEAWEWSCTQCEEPGDGLSMLLTMLARAGCEPERVDG